VQRCETCASLISASHSPPTAAISLCAKGRYRRSVKNSCRAAALRRSSCACARTSVTSSTSTRAPAPRLSGMRSSSSLHPCPSLPVETASVETASVGGDHCRPAAVATAASSPTTAATPPPAAALRRAPSIDARPAAPSDPPRTVLACIRKVNVHGTLTSFSHGTLHPSLKTKTSRSFISRPGGLGDGRAKGGIEAFGARHSATGVESRRRRHARAAVSGERIFPGSQRGAAAGSWAGAGQRGGTRRPVPEVQVAGVEKTRVGKDGRRRRRFAGGGPSSRLVREEDQCRCGGPRVRLCYLPCRHRLWCADSKLRCRHPSQAGQVGQVYEGRPYECVPLPPGFERVLSYAACAVAAQTAGGLERAAVPARADSFVLSLAPPPDKSAQRFFEHGTPFMVQDTGGESEGRGAA
jgi:hypothetical protein